MTCYEDLGIEVALGRDGTWFCWLRGDTAGRYHRFIHIRHLRTTDELILLIEGLTGQAWNAANNYYDSIHTSEQAKRIREEHEHMDHRLRKDNCKWAEIEKDDTRGRALPEHYEAHKKSRA